MGTVCGFRLQNVQAAFVAWPKITTDPGKDKIWDARHDASDPIHYKAMEGKTVTLEVVGTVPNANDSWVVYFGVDIQFNLKDDPLDTSRSWNINSGSNSVAKYQVTGDLGILGPSLEFLGIEDK